MASVTFDEVTKRFGDTVAVDRLSLEIEDKEFMVLLGPSGCGKTTALRMISGLESITSGTLSIGDRVVNDVEPRDRDIAMVFQSYALYPHMTVRKNIESPLSVREFSVDGGPARKLTKAERAERIHEAARMLDLDRYLDRKPGALSGGQRQRVALARAIVSRPQAFLMDEPLSNLDAKLRAQTRAELTDLHRRLGTTVIYVTHDQVEAMTMATRIAIMANGQLQQVGTPREVYDRPANLFVAQFIGTPPMNTLDGVARADAEPGIEIGEARAPLPTGLQSRPADGQPVTLGIRPEHLVLVPGEPTGDGHELPAVVRNVEWLGHECLITAEVHGQKITARQSGMSTLAPGAPLTLRFDPAHTLLFDTQTTELVS